jgi:hemerythrin-like domain-containing protein
MSRDAIVLLREDHRELKRVFRDYEATGEEAHVAQARLVRRMIELLTVHTYLENECVYPRIEALVPELADEIRESYEEHHVADLLCAELAAMDPGDDHFAAKVAVLIENVEHHIKEEETGWFPTVREKLGRKPLQEIGDRLLGLRPDAPKWPTRPGAVKKALRALVS